MFWTVSLSIIRSISLYHGCLYSEILLMMDRGTVRNI